MKLSDGKIGIRECTTVIIMMMGIKFSDTTPALLFQEGKNAAWTIPLINGAVMLLPLLCLLQLVKKHKDKGLIDIIYQLTGKYCGFLISAALFIVSLIATAFNSRSYADIMGTLFYPTTPLILIYVLIIGFSCYVAVTGIEGISRTAYITIPYILLTTFVLIFSLVDELEWKYLFPLAGPGIPVLLKEGIMKSSLFGDILYVAVLFPFVRNYRDFKISSYISFLFSIGALALFLAVYIMVFDTPGVELIAFHYQEITRFVKIGEFFTNTEAFFLIFWVVASIVHFAVYLFITTIIFSQMIGVHKYKPLLAPIAGLVVAIGLVPENYVQAIFIGRSTLLDVSSFFLIMLPPLLWILSLLRRGTSP
ncbi:GerAB/ArcD/ProY family transporter [Paenibacillus turpanensis]|uniref:GerAB/ArcD/ProY family transporter n=1 Tax=Paenibacillus turpanensis TaxID=2689078 RepID=UPI00140987F5|nr:endospore germination permease [Paenibacillus turpanensis]